MPETASRAPLREKVECFSVGEGKGLAKVPRRLNQLYRVERRITGLFKGIDQSKYLAREI